MFVFWIFLYIVGFVATTITMKFFKLGEDLGGDWWMAVFMWPIFVPIALGALFVTKIACTAGSWWDKVSDELVEKLREMGSRNSAE